MINQVLQGDCLTVMRELPNDSVDLICTDPPYFRVKKENWDRQWDKPEEFLSWLDSVAEQWQRVLKPNGSLYCFAFPKMAARVEVMLGERFEVGNRITWQKDLGWGKRQCKGAQRWYFPASEAIIFCGQYGVDNAAKGKAGYGAKCNELKGVIFEPLRAYLDEARQAAGLTLKDVSKELQKKTKSKTLTGAASNWFNHPEHGLPSRENYLWLQALMGVDVLPRNYESIQAEYEELRIEYEELRRPFNVTFDVPYTDVWTFPTVSHYPGKHPCEKPAELLEHIIKASSRPSAVVLDSFAGSGSTLLASKKLGRDYIGIEIDPHWVDTANQRLGNFHNEPTLEERVRCLETQVKAQNSKIKKIENKQLSLFSDLA